MTAEKYKTRDPTHLIIKSGASPENDTICRAQRDCETD